MYGRAKMKHGNQVREVWQTSCHDIALHRLQQEWTMPERILTDSRGQRWDVIQPDAGSPSAVFRHQSGQELRADLARSLDQLSSEDLLNALDEARRREGLDDVGHGGLDVAFDADGYETGR